ncbi:M48 family metallopeptidase [Sunxiuqinia sp. A32]|uniref:M48 family metallopeptidase n=1 Tax=Sunxiuqinia sp. A32 TaxID=3461496 RepID=UPI0040451D7B
MSAEKTIFIEPVGPVLLKKSNRSRHLRLRVNSGGQAQVSMPAVIPESKVIHFVKSKTEWIQQQQQKILAGLTVYTTDTAFQTKFHKLKIVITNQKRITNHVGNGILQINIPERYDIQQPEIQQFIRQTLNNLMRNEAKFYLPERIAQLAGKYGFSYEKVFVKHVKSRWGSCSSVNNINLNIHLMRLPDHLIDYVLLHELAHTIEKNHSKRFWDLLEKVCPGTKTFNKELKKYQVDIF